MPAAGGTLPPHATFFGGVVTGFTEPVTFGVPRLGEAVGEGVGVAEDFAFGELSPVNATTYTAPTPKTSATATTPATIR